MSVRDFFGKKDDDAKAIDIVGAKARICLTTNEFKDYREEYESAEKELVNQLIVEAGEFIAGDSSTLEKFGARCLIKLNRLRDVRAMLVAVTVNSKRGKK